MQVGQDVCKSCPGSCFSDHSNSSLAAALTLNAKHTDRHNLSALTSSLTHKLFVNVICRRVWMDTCTQADSCRELLHTHIYVVYIETLYHIIILRKAFTGTLEISWFTCWGDRGCALLLFFRYDKEDLWNKGFKHRTEYKHVSLSVCVCVCKLYMHRLFLNEAQQGLIRGSIGLADGAGTPLK